jgi:hypothetical protein
MRPRFQPLQVPVLLIVALAGARVDAAPPCPAGARGSFRLIVLARDHVTREPISGAEVTVSHRGNRSKHLGPGADHPHAEDELAVRCPTGLDGQAVFWLPDLDYEVQVLGPPGERYLDAAGIAPYARALQQRERLQTETFSADRKTKTVTASLVRASVVEGPGVVRTPERAAELARAALASCLDLPELEGIVPQAANYQGEWSVDFSTPRPRVGADYVGPPPRPPATTGPSHLGIVTVNAISGAARVVECAHRCCRSPRDEPNARALYPPSDAIADALSEPLVHAGTGIWPGILSIPACAYRNSRVLVVDVYCTLKEISTFSIVVLHPARGTVSFYAEARSPISTLLRPQYQHWRVTAGDPSPPEAVPALSVAMDFRALASYEKQRRELADAGCWAEAYADRAFPPGTSSQAIGSWRAMVAQTGRGTCRHKTPEVEATWARQAEPLLEDPPAGWYPLVKQLRALARKHGRPDPR